MKRLRLIQVTVLDDSYNQKCGGRCGMDLSSPRQLKAIAKMLKKI